ncbi:MAG TPA: enoyl-CoA hydratase/isomerase family protein [Chitinophagales bacterium]|nr:enoyl-CoA hydratase/isomerase family protein [Chitinophagales bacterium]
METLKLTQKEDYSILMFDRGRSNPMNMQMFEEMIEVLKTLKSDDKTKALIITGKENFFSSGLDLPEIMNYDRVKTKQFWKAFMDLIIELVSFPKPLVAAITGHSPAGGCIVAIACDYRIMGAGNFKIGLNEIPVGITVPRHVFELYSFWLGKHRAYQFLMEGRLMNPQQASDAGLVDVVVPAEQVLETAERKVSHYLKFDQKTWSATKLNLRTDMIHTVTNYEEDLLDKVVEHWFHPHTQSILNGFVAMLQKK